MEQIDKIKQEIQEDLKLDRISLLEKQLILPAIKHKWVSRLIEYKKTKNSLNKKRKNLKEEAMKTFLNQKLPDSLPKASIDKKIESSEVFQKINDELEEVELVIDYLEKVETICRSMTYDIKNAVELEKLETT